ncbi:MAG: glycosyltransferase [Proteobacteria bacterium]|nr:glycosyltransferase [Pseudomonadota bacterium]
MNRLQQLIYNEGERLVPYVSHNEEELVRHRSSYAFFYEVITKDLEIVPFRKNRKLSIIDLGFGCGFGCAILSNIPHSVITGIDIGKECKTYAQQYYFRDNVEYIIEDLIQFIPRMPSYDYAVSRGVLEHIPNGLALIDSISCHRRIMIDVPYNEKPGNQHHVLTAIREDSFSHLKNCEIFYEDIDGAIYPGHARPENANMIMAIVSHPDLPKVSTYFDFPIMPVRTNELEKIRGIQGVASRFYYDTWQVLLKSIEQFITQSDVVLDLGCGIRPMNHFKPKLHLMVEPCLEYVDILKYRNANDKSTLIFQQDALSFLKKMASQSVDSIFMLDVIEHIEKEQGQEIIKECERVAREQIVLFTPMGYLSQHCNNDKDAWGLTGGAFQNHLSGWSLDEFDGTWNLHVCNEFHISDVYDKEFEYPHGAFFAIKNISNKIKFKTENLASLTIPFYSAFDAEKFHLENQRLQEEIFLCRAQLQEQILKYYQLSQMLTPLVSIILPTYNRAHFLAETIESVLNQTYSHFELIIVDDGSTDNTQALISQYTDPRIIYIKQENHGRSHARNHALSIMKGDLIAFLDSDDLYLKNKLELQVAYFSKHPEANMIYTSAYCIDSAGKLLSTKYMATRSGNIYFEIACFKPITITLPTVMVRKNILIQAGNFDEKMYRFEDTDMWRRIAKISRIDALSEYTCKLRTHQDNHLVAQDPIMIMNALDYYAQKILQEDSMMGLKHLYDRLYQLYTHYGEALCSRKPWVVYGNQLINKAIAYQQEGKLHAKPVTDNKNGSSFLPLVSIIIPVYNGANFLKEAIESALNQSYKYIEIIVVNDGSKDNGATRQIAHSFGESIRYFEQENQGVASALNLGIRQMKGEYFSWLSHDDLYLPDKIEKQINVLSKLDPNTTILYGNYSVFTTDPNVDILCKMKGVPAKAFRYWITTENCLHGCTLLIPKHAFLEYGEFNENLRTTQDYDRWFTFAKYFDFVHMDEHLVKARSHQDQGTRQLVDIVLPECNQLLIHFIHELTRRDLENAADHSIGLAYAKIASSMWYRGFFPAADLAARYSVKNLLNIPFREIIYALMLLVKGFTLFCIIKPLRKTLSPYRRLSIRKLWRQAKQFGPETLKGLDLKKRFTAVYEHNIFNGRVSRSGEGSDLVQTQVIRNEIPKLLEELQIKIFLDAPCGDCYWMQYAHLNVQNYIGVDIVDDLIQKNTKSYGKDSVTFQCLNLVNDPIPKADLIFSRDCFVHLSFKDILAILANFKASGAKYLLTTTFARCSENQDLGDTFWRTLNMQLAPFNFPPPLKVINEACTEENNLYADKGLGLWLLDDLLIGIK